MLCPPRQTFPVLIDRSMAARNGPARPARTRWHMTTLTRRNLLTRAAVVGGAAALSGSAALPGSALAASAGPDPTGPAIVGPDDPRYGDLVLGGNQRFIGRP